MNLKSGYRSLAQILEKPYVGSRGYIFAPILKKLDQSICLDKKSLKMVMWDQ